MCSSYAIVESLLADLMGEVKATAEVYNPSLELSITSTPDHPLRCSADFQFFFSVSTTAPPHSPDCGSSPTCSTVTPPPSPGPPPSPSPSLSSPLHSISASPSPPSPGVALLPLSGQMTQVVQQAHTITLHQQEVTNSAVNLLTRSLAIQKEEGEPARKKIKLEVMEQVDLLGEEETDADLELDQEDDIVESNIASYDSDDEMLPFPLTFNTSADLRWKLQKADILPAVSVIASQRPDGGLQLCKGVRVERGKRKRINLGPWVTVGDFIKQEEVKEVEDTQKEKDVFSGDEISSIKDDEDERAVPSEYVQLFYQPARCVYYGGGGQQGQVPAEGLHHPEGRVT